ncbi:hypothetical protein [Alkalihalobacillus sp. TS-13]|uniref:hypothetical protein n=1 Tax=Alkalihalobacillus sp. TS-13 TaxID=2842455 RepID=UPI001C8886D4|nr:hypothetical protein [Alkalihalobacillus sp. TS-13]
MSYLGLTKYRWIFPCGCFYASGQGNRTTFLSEAEALVLKGIVSLLITAPAMRSRTPQDLSEEQILNLMIETITNIRQYTQTVVDIQRGVDLLCSFENIDKNLFDTSKNSPLSSTQTSDAAFR